MIATTAETRHCDDAETPSDNQAFEETLRQQKQALEENERYYTLRFACSDTKAQVGLDLYIAVLPWPHTTTTSAADVMRPSKMEGCICSKWSDYAHAECCGLDEPIDGGFYCHLCIEKVYSHYSHRPARLYLDYGR